MANELFKFKNNHYFNGQLRSISCSDISTFWAFDSSSSSDGFIVDVVESKQVLIFVISKFVVRKLSFVMLDSKFCYVDDYVLKFSDLIS